MSILRGTDVVLSAVQKDKIICFALFEPNYNISLSVDQIQSLIWRQTDDISLYITMTLLVVHLHHQQGADVLAHFYALFVTCQKLCQEPTAVTATPPHIPSHPRAS